MIRGNLPDDFYTKVVLDWAPPIKCFPEEYVILPDDAYKKCGLYRFERHHPLHNGAKRKVAYIGITYNQNLGERVYQYTPQKLEKWRNRGTLWISYAEVEVYNGNISRSVFETVEHILAFMLQPNENIRKVKSIPSGVWYRIINKGNKGELPREILYPDINIKW